MPGRYLGIPKKERAVGFLIIIATKRWVKADIAQYKFKAEGKNTTMGIVKKGKYLKYFAYFAKGELLAIFPILGFIEIFKYEKVADIIGKMK